MSEFVGDVRPAPSVASTVRTTRSSMGQRLSVGATNDPAEREADLVAAEVMRNLGGRADERTRGLFTSATRIRRTTAATQPTEPSSAVDVSTDASPVIRRDWRLAKVRDWHAELNQTPLEK